MLDEIKAEFQAQVRSPSVQLILMNSLIRWDSSRSLRSRPRSRRNRETQSRNSDESSDEGRGKGNMGKREEREDGSDPRFHHGRFSIQLMASQDMRRFGWTLQKRHHPLERPPCTPRSSGTQSPCVSLQPIDAAALSDQQPSSTLRQSKGSSPRAIDDSSFSLSEA
jgi:hypothetical protein